MPDLSQLSDEEVLRLAGVKPAAAPSAAPDFSKMSDEEVLRLAGGKPASPFANLDTSVPAGTPVSQGAALKPDPLTGQIGKNDSPEAMGAESAYSKQAHAQEWREHPDFIRRITLPVEEAIARQSPGGDLFEAPFGKRFDAAAGAGFSSAGAAIMAHPAALGATSLFEAPGVKEATAKAMGAIDEKVAQPLGHLAAGMPEGPKSLKAGERAPVYQGSEAVRSAVNVALPILGGATVVRMLRKSAPTSAPAETPLPVEDRGTVIPGEEAVKLVRSREAPKLRASEAVPEAKPAIPETAPILEQPKAADGVVQGKPPATPDVAPATPSVSGEKSAFSGRGLGSEAGVLNVEPVVKGAKAAEGWIETAEKPINKLTGKVADKVSDVAGPVGTAVGNLRDWVLKSRESKIGPNFEKIVRGGEAVTNELKSETQSTVRAFEKAKLTPDEALEVGKSLNSEPADLSSLSPEKQGVVEATRGKLQDVRQKEVESGSLSPEAFGEYDQGHLTRIPKPGLVGTAQRLLTGMKGNKGVGPYKMAKDMYAVTAKLSEVEARELVPEGSPLRYLKDQGDGKVLVQFTDSPEGMKARDAFVEGAKAKFAEGRSRLSADATTAIKAGDVREAKMLQTAQLDTPRASDLAIETSDPIDPATADRIFVKDTNQRLYKTLTTSAERLGRSKVLSDIATSADEQGRPYAIEPQNAGRAARGLEKAPDGYTWVSNEKLGPLSGKFVRTEVADYVRGAYSPEAAGFFKGVSQGMMERFKVARLLYNPRQAFRQLSSNFEFENLMGVSNWGPRYIYHKLNGLRAMTDGSPFYKELVSHGFLKNSMVTNAEIGLAAQELNTTSAGAVGHRIGKAIGSLGATEIAPGAVKALDSRMGNMYGFADAWTKATGYVFAREELGMSPADAAAYVREWTPNPESVSDAIKAYSRHIIGDPWARYRAEQARINLAAARQKPIRLAMNRTQGTLLRGAAVTLGASALSDNEEKALKNEQGGGAVAVGRDEQGRPLAIDYSFLSTLGDWMSTPSEIGKPGEHAVERGLQVTGLGDNPLLSIASDQISRHDKYGRPVNPEGTASGAAYSAGASFIKQFVPSLLTNHREKLQAAWEGKPYSPNQPAQTKAQAVLDVFFGFKLTPLDADQALLKIQRQGARAVDDIKSNLRSKAIRGEPVDMQHAAELAELLRKEYEERSQPLNEINKASK